MSYGFAECIDELFKIFLIKKNFVFLITILTDPLALGYRNVKVLLRLGCFYIKEICPLSGTNTPGKDLFIVIIFQGQPPPRLSLYIVVVY